MSSKAISVSRPKPIMKGNVALEPEMEISHNTATLAYKPDEMRAKFAPEGYEYQQKMSNKYRAVFLNKKTNQIQLAYKGTDPTHTADLIADANLMAGTQVFNKRFKDETNWFRDNLANTKYDVEISGHSLGGSIASHINTVFKDSTNIKHIYTYNMGHGLFGDMMGGSHDFNSN